MLQMWLRVAAMSIASLAIAVAAVAAAQSRWVSAIVRCSPFITSQQFELRLKVYDN